MIYPSRPILRSARTGMKRTEVRFFYRKERSDALQKVIDRIEPDKIQLNTVIRPPADSRALSLDRQGLEEIKTFLGQKPRLLPIFLPSRDSSSMIL